MVSIRKNSNSSSNYSKNNRSPRKTANARRRDCRPKVAQGIVLGVIGVAVLSVVGLAIFALNYNPGSQDQVEAKIASLAQAYYETYYYPDAFGDDLDKATDFLSRFAESGLSRVSLRQILLLTPGVTESEKTLLREKCNENATSVIYYPEAPYEQGSYHTEFHYSCNFD